MSVRRVTRWSGCLAAPLLAATYSVCLAAESPLGNGALPLDTPRQVTFDTNEGTAMSVDVSPDGRTLVFDLLGDLYLLPVEGGRARTLTRGSPYDHQPRFSPDGRWIVFVSDRSGSTNLWLVSTDGRTLRQLSAEPVGTDVMLQSPSWAPSADRVVAFRSRNWLWLDEYPKLPRELREYDVSGGESRSLTGEGAASIRGGPMGPVYTPDGTQILFSLAAPSEGRFRGERLPGHWQLASLDLKTRQIKREDALEGGMRPHVSPDGRWLVYAARSGAETGLRLRERASGHENWLMVPITADLQDGVLDHDLVPGFGFLPDSSAIVLSAAGRLWRVSLPDGRRTEIPFRAAVEQHLAPLLRARVDGVPATTMARHVGSPAVSPDGRQVVFQSLRRLWIMDLPDGKPRRLTDGSATEYQPAWSPDGRFIVYATWEEPRGGQLLRIARTGGAPDVLSTVRGYHEWPVVTPDGTGVLFAFLSTTAALERFATERDIFSLRKIRRVPIDGGEPETISSGEWPTGRLHFARDRSRVFFTERGGRLVSLGVADGVRREHFAAEFGLDRVPAREIVVSPATDAALVETTADVFVVPFDPARTETLHLDRLERSTSRSLKDLQGTRNYPGYGRFASWAADGRRFYAAAGPALFEAIPATGTLDRFLLRRHVLPVHAERPAAAPAVVLRNARVLTMVGDEVLESADLLVEGGRIGRIAPAGTLAAPTGASELDLRGMTVLPGFVDTHCHALYGQSPAGQTTPWQFLNYLAYGVTTCYDVATSFDEFALKDLLDAEQILGPRYFATGPVTLPSVSLVTAADADDFLGLLKNGYGAQIYKEYHPGSRLQRQWLAAAGARLGMGGISETSGLGYATGNLADGLTGLAHSLDHAPLHRDLIELLARSGTAQHGQLTTLRYEGAMSSMYWFMDREDLFADCKLRRFMPASRLQERTFLRPTAPREAHRFPEYARTAAALVRAGVNYGVGEHGEWKGFGFHWEMWSLAEGMPVHAVLRSATASGAAAMGLGHDLGTVEVGKLADLVVVRGDPLADIRATRDIAYVVKGGRVFDADTLEPLGGDSATRPPRWDWTQRAPGGDPDENATIGRARSVATCAGAAP